MDKSTLQIIALFCGSGIGVTVLGFGAKAYVSKLISPKLYCPDGTSIFVPRKECEKNTDEYRNKVCNELKSLKEGQDAEALKTQEVVNFTNALKGYYAAKGVKF